MKTRIMYIEYKGSDIVGPARIGRVTFSKSGRTLYYHDKTFQTLDGSGYKANYVDINTGEWYWISGCRKDGNDRLYPGIVDIDEDVREEYWLMIRNKPECTHLTSYQSMGKYQK